MLADKEEIRARSDIVEIVGAVVQLRHRGRTWVGLCPFHQEKTPSFSVDPVTQSFKCFGCGASGDVFGFVERYQNMSFVEAAEHLAHRAGLELKRSGGAARPRGERDLLFQVNAAAVIYFRQVLARAEAAQSYLAGRGLTPETIEQFAIGFANESWDGLVSFLHAQRYDMRIAAAAGLVKARDGEYHDAFRNRIIFPIHDEHDRIVGFGGRAMGDDPPKYLNTSETPLFQKSRLLYGLPFARKAIADSGYALLVEGYMDVVTTHQAGFSCALATLGTALTTEHAKRIARLAPTAIIAYDADEAGIRATVRAAAELERESLVVRVVALPAGEDPDSLVRSGRAAELQRAIDGSVSRVEFEIERAIAGADQSSDLGRQALLRQVLRILASVPSRTERDPYIEKVWRLHPMSGHGPGIAKQQMHLDAEQVAARRATARTPDRQGPGAGRAADRDPGRAVATAQTGAQPSAVATAAMRAENTIISALVRPEWRAVLRDLVSDDDMRTPEARAAVRWALDADSLPEDGAAFVAALRSALDSAICEPVLVRMQEFAESMQNEPITDAALIGAARTLRRRRIADLNAELVALLQDRTELLPEDRERVAELHRTLAELKGSAGSAKGA